VVGVAELPQTPYERWRHALKPDSWAKLVVPTYLGQALGAAHLGRLDLVPAFAGFVFTYLVLTFIVLMNDVADREVDAIKRQRFPHGCSPKTIPDGILPASRVLMVGLAAGAAAVGFAYFAEGWLNRPGLGLVAIVSVGLFVAYSLPPLKLNYRGGGELLEMVGVGLVLPWLNAYMQGGLGAESVLWLPRAWPLLIGAMTLALASAVASGLSDEISDRVGGKTTFTTKLGNPMARRLTELLVALGALAWLLAGVFAEHVPLVVVLLPVLILAFRLRQMIGQSTSAVTNAFGQQKVYKTYLHRGIWRGTEVLAFSLLLHRLFLG
jgi:4-hydroxybenzoate polyprenyltransferase